MNCPFCQNQLRDGSKFCNKCGKQIPYCPTCGTLIPRGIKFCVNDGTPVPESILNLYASAPEEVGQTQILTEPFAPGIPTEPVSPQNDWQENTWHPGPDQDQVFAAYFDHSEDTGPQGGQADLWGAGGYQGGYDDSGEEFYPQEEDDLQQPAPRKKNTTRTVLIIVLIVLVLLLAACAVFLVPRILGNFGISLPFGQNKNSEAEEEILEEEPTDDFLEWPDEEEEEKQEEESAPEEEEEEEEIQESTPDYSLTLNNLFLSLEVGDTWAMSVTVRPSDAALVWTSDDPDVATVDASGVVTAVGAGDCTISVRLAEDSTYTGRCTVTVYGGEEPEAEEEEYSETDQKILDLINLCSVRYLTDADLADCDADMCKKVRNGIYAVHGRMFTTPELMDYFTQFDWYEPTIPANSFDATVLNAYELANASFISNYEKEHGFNQ